MRKLIVLIVLLPLLAQAQSYKAYDGGSSVADTIIGTAGDTTGIFALWRSTSSPRPGDPTWEFYLDVISGTDMDSLVAELWVTSRSATLGSSDLGWCKVATYNLYDYGVGVSGADRSYVVPTDTLQYISSLYARWVIYDSGASATDSTAYGIVFLGDRGANP